jgi:hypothetical protein
MATVNLTEWTTYGGDVYPPGEHEIEDKATAEALEASEQRTQDRLQRAQQAADAELEVPERRTMVGVHNYVTGVERPDMADAEAVLHPDGEQRQQISVDADQAAFDFTVTTLTDSQIAAATPEDPQAANKPEPVKASSSSTKSAAPAAKPVPTGNASGGGSGSGSGGS